jgi:hypothetical protein
MPVSRFHKETTMRRLLIASCLLASAVLYTNAYADDPVPAALTPIEVKEIFVPVGFDSNDETTAVVDGYLPDTCYRLAFNEVSYDATSRTYTVKQYARHFSGVCLEILVPFTAEARLGRLDAGDYKVASASGVATVQDLTVTQAPLGIGPDDYLYAPVESVRVEKDATTGRYRAVIEGRFTNSCVSIQELRLVDSGRTLQLLPITSFADQGACQAVETPFTETVDLPTTMTAGRHLLHVRSLNGKAANAVFTVL